MKKIYLFFIITTVIIIGLPGLNFAQNNNLIVSSLYSPILGTINNAVVYGNGLISNIGTSTFSGNLGSASATAPSNFIFSKPWGINSNNLVTTQYQTDLMAAYKYFSGNTIPSIIYTSTIKTTIGAPDNGNNAATFPETAGVSQITSNSFITTDKFITFLESNSLQNSVFINYVKANKLVVSSSTKMNIGSASPSNIYWIVDGNITIAAPSTGNIIYGTFIATGNITVDAGCVIIGRLFSTAGTITVTSSSLSLPNNTSTWAGNSTVPVASMKVSTSDWATGSNWYQNVPTGMTASSAIIPSATVNPTIGATTVATVNNLTQNTGAALTLATGATLQVSGAISNSGTINASTGTTILMNGTAAQTITGSTGAVNNFNNLTFSNTGGSALTKVVTTIAGPASTNVTGTLSFGTLNNTLNTGGFLTLKSLSTGTAQLASTTGNILNGAITVERYIAQKRSWVLLAPPLTSASSPTIYNSWQETAGTAIGLGTIITNGTTASNGFDKGVNLNSSIKYFDAATQKFLALPNTAVSGTYIPITTYPGYFLFIRGDRTVTAGLGKTFIPTTLRMSGNVNTGSVGATVAASGYTFVGNPYPASINFSTVSLSNVSNSYYAWDAQLTGNNGFGCYVLYTSSGSTPATPDVTNFIPGGSAFFLKAIDITKPGTVTFNESDKAIGASDAIFKQGPNQEKKLSVNLLGVNPINNSTYILDGILTSYAKSGNNAVDNEDFIKLYNLSENMATLRENKLLIVERRAPVKNADTTFIGLYLLKKQKYKFDISASNLDNNELHAVLKDKYDSALNNTVIALNGKTEITFTANADAASRAIDRFSIVFGKGKGLEIKFVILKATAKLKHIEVEWENPSEIDLKKYEVETSANGIDFIPGTTLVAKHNNSNAAKYRWLDLDVTDGLHYYRIKYTDIYDRQLYSSTVKVLVDNKHSASSIIAYPNIIKDNVITYQLNNIKAGTYAVKLYSLDGQLVNTSSIVHNGNNSTVYTFKVNGNLVMGKYTLYLSSETVNLSTAIIKN